MCFDFGLCEDVYFMEKLVPQGPPGVVMQLVVLTQTGEWNCNAPTKLLPSTGNLGHFYLVVWLVRV